MKNNEKGQAILTVLILVAFGGLVIAPFLEHAGGGLLGSRLYGEVISQLYSSDAGVEHAIWDLTYGDLAGQLPFPGDNTSYQLGEAINGISPDIFVVRTDNVTYEITSVAGNETIWANVEITGQNVTIRNWEVTS
jgi:hypothetical protein